MDANFFPRQYPHTKSGSYEANSNTGSIQWCRCLHAKKNVFVHLRKQNVKSTQSGQFQSHKMQFFWANIITGSVQGQSKYEFTNLFVLFPKGICIWWLLAYMNLRKNLSFRLGNHNVKICLFAQVTTAVMPCSRMIRNPGLKPCASRVSCF